MSQRFTNIIISDSRGRGLEEFIGSHPTPIDHDYVVEVLPGKAIHEMVNLISNKISRYNPDFYYCIVFAGICGLTERVKIGSSWSLRYPEHSREHKVHTTINTIQGLKHKYGKRINFCTIVPASLTEYFQHYNSGRSIPRQLKTEQIALEADINKINSFIKSLNESETTTINISSRFHVKSKKKRQRSGNKVVYRRVSKFSTKGLVDGVHFTQILKAVSFSLIIDTAIRDLRSLSGRKSDSHRLQPWPVGADQAPDNEPPRVSAAKQDRSPSPFDL